MIICSKNIRACLLPSGSRTDSKGNLGDGQSLFQAQVVDAKSGETWLYPRPVYALNRPRNRFLSLSFQRLHWLYRGYWTPCFQELAGRSFVFYMGRQAAKKARLP